MRYCKTSERTNERTNECGDDGGYYSSSYGSRRVIDSLRLFRGRLHAVSSHSLSTETQTRDGDQRVK